jgi:hypothetical protein
MMKEMSAKTNSLNRGEYKSVVVNIPLESRWKPLEQDKELSSKILEKWLIVSQLNNTKRTMIVPSVYKFFAKYFLRRFGYENSKQTNFRPIIKKTWMVRYVCLFLENISINFF